MKKISKIIILLFFIIIILSNTCFAQMVMIDDGGGGGSYLTAFGHSIKWSSPNAPQLQKAAKKILVAVRNIAVIAAVIVISILGVKYMVGSAEQKAGYKKAFIPLTVGIVLVAGASQFVLTIVSLAR